MQTLANYVGGREEPSRATDFFEVRNPATGETLARAPQSTAEDVDRAAAAAAAALPAWRRTPPGERVQPLFRLKRLLERDFDELARQITLECGKTLAESRGELQRAVENVETACGAPALLQGQFSEDIASGIDEFMIRQPVGVCAVLAPFNFPAMIPMWFLPYAVACGNTLIVKPSEKTPLAMQRIAALVAEADFPEGVVNLVHGGRETAEALIDHPTVRAISFVGSTAAARAVYARAAARGKRVQCQGGAKNPLVILPDADLDSTVRIAADSAFGCAGQRCLASSVAVAVGEARSKFSEAIAEAAAARQTGSGLEEGTEMGPVISAASRERIEALIEQGGREGGRIRVDGRHSRIAGCEGGSFVRPTVLEGLPPESDVARTEIFGPVLSVVQAEDVDEAIALINSGAYGNMACLFTQDGRAARRFRYEAEVGNVGVNVGVAAPMAYFPFSGWKESFFGDLHAQGRDAFQFYTQEKVVVERWPAVLTRKF